VTSIVDRLSPRMRAVFALATSALALFGLGILVQGSVLYFLETTNMGQVTGIPYKFAVAPVLLAAISCGVIVLNDLFATFRALARGAGLES
jgi:TRAP-type C4-dicarboxylate transport system permease small subunit